MAMPAMGSPPSNTYLETAGVGVREDLADIIYRIDPDETPFVSSLSRVQAHQVNTEWIDQELNPAENNPQPEGFTAVIQAVKKPVRFGNICQIFARTVGVSNTYRAVDMVGGEDEYNRNIMLRGMELKRDLELVSTSPIAKAITDPRQMAGLPAWCSLGVRGAGTGVMPIGDGTNVGTAGTLYDLDLAHVNTAMQAVWNAGGNPALGLMSGNIKNYFSTLSQGGTGNPIVAQNIVNASPTGTLTIQGAVDVYRTNFGTLQLAPDRFCPAHQILLVDKNYVELAPLPGRDMVQTDLAKTGDNSQGMIVFEGTLRVTAPKANAWVADLNQ
jgi:Family of unknown function (DUF5309)